MSPRRLPIVCAVFAAFACLAAPARAQTGWSFFLEWEHDGANVSHFRLCVDGTCDTLSANRTAGTTWRAALPLLAAGERRLVVQACNGALCTNGRPDLVVRVQAVTPGAPSTPVPPPPSKTKGATLTGTRAVPRVPR